MEIGRFMRISQVCNWRIYDVDGDVGVVLLALFGECFGVFGQGQVHLKESW
jgi:hypothetical protein